MINLQPETIVGEFQDTFKNIMTINMYAQQVALIQIELEQEPNVYRYTFRMVDGTKLITRVNFDFPYLTTLPIGQEYWIRRLATGNIEITVVTDRARLMGMIDKGEAEEIAKPWRIGLSNGLTVEKTALKKIDNAQLQRINQQLNNPQIQSLPSYPGMISATRETVFGTLTQMQMPQMQVMYNAVPQGSASTAVNDAMRLPSYRGYILLTDDIALAKFIGGDRVGYHVEIVDNQPERCSCCGYNMISINGDRVLCPACGSNMKADYNHTRNLVLGVQ